MVHRLQIVSGSNRKWVELDVSALSSQELDRQGLEIARRLGPELKTSLPQSAASSLSLEDWLRPHYLRFQVEYSSILAVAIC